MSVGRGVYLENRNRFRILQSKLGAIFVAKVGRG